MHATNEFSFTRRPPSGERTAQPIPARVFTAGRTTRVAAGVPTAGQCHRIP
jgi:hypothetical protein